MRRAFLDSNILVYCFTADDPRQEPSLELLAQSGVISVQCLNEFAAVTRRKLKFTWQTLRDAVEQIQLSCDRIIPVTTELHQQGMFLAERYMLSTYDGMIVGAALATDCNVLWSEDMHHDLLVEDRLRIRNPFLPG